MSQMFKKLKRALRSINEQAGQLKIKSTAVAEKAETAYGNLRLRGRSRREAQTPRELLEITRDELLYVIACILQVSPKNAAKWTARFGKALTGKLAAAGVTTSLLTLVATFGTAGTGAAISGLSGAAAASATLAWIGGLVGGGMVAGSFLTGGLGLLVGLGVYKAVGSKGRSLDDLDGIEKAVVETSAVLVATIDEALGDSVSGDMSPEMAEAIYRNVLIPLNQRMVTNCDDICLHLDRKNAIAFRQHSLPDFERNVIDGFDKYLYRDQQHVFQNSESRKEYLIGGVFYALLSQNAVGDDPESQNVLNAIRRSNSTLENASEAEITDYLSTKSPEQLQGISNNVKGIYHEISYVEHYNATHSDTYAQLHGATNHPGADVRIRDKETGDVVGEIQLKATDSKSYVNEHLEKYPEIDVMVTEEVALTNDGYESSGFRNEDLERQVDGDMNILANNTEFDQGLESAGLASLIASGRNAIDVLQGRKTVSESARRVVDAMTVSGSSTVIAAFLFS